MATDCDIMRLYTHVLMIEATEQRSAAKYCPEAVRRYGLTRLRMT